jgi:hypothetical protein
MPRPAVKVLPDERTNSVVVVSARCGRQKNIVKLDVERPLEAKHP